MIPKLAQPFHFTNGRATTVEQHSDEEIGQCIAASVRTRPGQRIERSDYGSRPEAFQQGGPDLAALRAAVLRDEPRARALVTQDPSLLDGLVARIRVEQE